MEGQFKIMGGFTWKQIRDFMIQKLDEITTEEEFLYFIKHIVISVGTVEDIKKTRKRLGIKPLAKEETKEFE